MQTAFSTDESTEHASGPLPSEKVTGTNSPDDALDAALTLCLVEEETRLPSDTSSMPFAVPVAPEEPPTDVGKIAMREVDVDKMPNAVDPVVVCAGCVVVVVVVVVVAAAVVVVVAAAVVVVVAAAVVVVAPATVVVVVADVEELLPPQPPNVNKTSASTAPNLRYRFFIPLLQFLINSKVPK